MDTVDWVSWTDAWPTLWSEIDPNTVTVERMRFDTASARPWTVRGKTFADTAPDSPLSEWSGWTLAYATTQEAAEAAAEEARVIAALS
jgi:hypothetical protein